MRTALDLSVNPKISATFTKHKGLSNAMTENNRINTMNSNNELPLNLSINNNTIQPIQSIGKWMYETDDNNGQHITATNGTAIADMNQNVNNIFQIDGLHQDQSSSSDDIEYIETVRAGPSGNVITLDNSDLQLDCDVLNLQVDHIETIGDLITLDDLADDDIFTPEPVPESNDIEIIQVKYYGKPYKTDSSDIEVLSEILTPEEVIKYMRINLKEIQELTKLSLTTIRIIMNQYDWDRDRYLEAVLQNGVQTVLNYFKLVINYEPKSRKNAKRLKTNHNIVSQTSVASKENVDSSGAGSSGLVGATGHSNVDMKTCLVCFDEINKSDTYCSECNHWLCIDCWNQYIANHVKDSSSLEYITCPGDNCHRIIDDDDIISIIQEAVICDKYRRLISNRFVMISKNNLRWCPNGDCLHAVKVKNEGSQDIECICKTVYCFSCCDQWHEPLPCDLYKNWIQKYASQTVDPKSANWLTKHTKCCPKCRFPIQKDGGCNYVMCSKCRHQFCYICLGKCSHGRCLGQNLADAVAAQTNDSIVKNDLQVFPEFKRRYQSQSNQLSLERKLQEGVTKKLESEVKCQKFRSALKFLKSAFTVLCHCRQTLMYSYVFRYYAKSEPQIMDQYDSHLQALEIKTDELSKVLLSETTVIAKDMIVHMKRKVQSTYRECETKRSALVLHIRNGMNDNKWGYSLL